MATIQALNTKKSNHQRAHRVTVWAGPQSGPGARADWVIYSANVPSAIRRAIRAFRAGVGKNGRYSDWTVNVKPIREGEDIIPADT